MSAQSANGHGGWRVDRVWRAIPVLSSLAVAGSASAPTHQIHHISAPLPSPDLYLALYACTSFIVSPGGSH
jgi:hypothetical protein